MSLDSWVDRSSSGPSGVAVLLTKLHGCINQLEQFPVRVHELPGRRYVCSNMHMHDMHYRRKGRCCVLNFMLVSLLLSRGSHALKFFNSHQIKCTLERHPSSLDTNSWKGGVLRIDPLATIQVLSNSTSVLSPLLFFTTHSSFLHTNSIFFFLFSSSSFPFFLFCSTIILLPLSPSPHVFHPDTGEVFVGTRVWKNQ